VIVAAVVAGVLLVVLIVVGVRLQATGRRAHDAEAERDRLRPRARRCAPSSPSATRPSRS
jgi:hypothetical protein